MKTTLSRLQAGIVRAMSACLASAGCRKLDIGTPARNLPVMIVESIVSTPWQSLTFNGANHRLAIRLPPPHDGVALILAALTQSELIVPGHIVAELRATESVKHDQTVGLGLAVEILTITDFG